MKRWSRQRVVVQNKPYPRREACHDQGGWPGYSLSGSVRTRGLDENIFAQADLSFRIFCPVVDLGLVRKWALRPILVATIEQNRRRSWTTLRILRLRSGRSGPKAECEHKGFIYGQALNPSTLSKASCASRPDSKYPGHPGGCVGGRDESADDNKIAPPP